MLKHVVFTPDLRPTVSPELVAQFEQKRQRLAPGYSPEDARELVDWVKERLLIPQSEWEALLQVMERDHDIDSEKLLESVAGKLVKLQPPAASAPLIAAVESLPRIASGLILPAPLTPFSLEGRRLKSAPARESVGDEGDNNDELLNSLLSEWLQFYGPRSLAFINATLGIDRPTLSLAGC